MKPEECIEATIQKKIVVKTKGYRFVGTIQTVFKNTAGDWRIVVESIHAPGMLHIYMCDQVRLMQREDVKALYNESIDTWKLLAKHDEEMNNEST